MERGTSDKCQICSSKAESEKVLYVHYGARSCLKCKHFFRRNANKEIKKKCNLNCDISNKGRKACKVCRYEKCLTVGMDPARVLNEEDRKKYSHPKKKKQESSHSTNQSDENTELIPTIPSTPAEGLLLTPDESIWIDNIIYLYFKIICKTIRYDDCYIIRFVSCFMGKTPQIRDTLILESVSINKSRFQSLLVDGLGLDFKEISPYSYGLCILAFVAKSDSYPSISNMLHFVTQNDDLEYFAELAVLDKLPQKQPDKLCEDEIVSDLYPTQKMKILKDKVAEFLSNTEVYILVKLFILTFGSTNSKVQSWNNSIKRLLLKQLRYLCGTNDVDEYLNTFSNQFLAYNLLSEKILQLAKQG